MEKIIKKHFDIIFKDKFNLMLMFVFVLGNIINLGLFFNWLMVIASSYTVIGNNYIQTIGSFIVNNREKPVKNWVFLSLSFVITTLISWSIYKGSIDYSLLKNIEYQKDLDIIIVLVPLLLNIFTKYGIPVSATFLIIPLFGTNNTIHIMITKTITSYFLAFMASFFIWSFIYKHFINIIKNVDNEITKFWNIVEYATTAFVWMAWNILSICVFVVFVDRQFNVFELVIFNLIIILILYILISNSGGKIEKIIKEKKGSNNKKTTAIFNLLFAMILLYLQFFSNVPLTTTWVFLGLLAGRELAITYTELGLFSSGRSTKVSLTKIIMDLNKAVVGVVFSLLFVKVILIFVA